MAQLTSCMFFSCEAAGKAKLTVQSVDATLKLEQNVTPMICVTFVFWQELAACTLVHHFLSSAVMVFGTCRDAPYAWQAIALIAASLISSARADEDEHEEDGTWQKVFEFLAVTFLVGCSALFSGLTLGMTVSRLWYTVAVLCCVTVSTSITIVHRSAAFVLKIISVMGLDKIGLEIVSRGDDHVAAAYASKIIPVRANGNLLLCTLLLGNVAVNACTSILCSHIAGGVIGFLVSTAVITLLGEILPQAVCSRHALRIGSAVVPLVKLLILLMWPITAPLAWLLDKMLGDEIGTIHSRTELRELLQIHVKHGAIDIETGRELACALQYKDMEVKNAMTYKKDVFMLASSDKLNYATVTNIFKAGYSRIPVYGTDSHDIVGLILTKDLIFIDPEDETPVKNFVHIFGRQVQYVWPTQSLGEVLKMFKQGHGHMAIVRDIVDDGQSCAPSAFANHALHCSMQHAVCVHFVISTILSVHNIAAMHAIANIDCYTGSTHVHTALAKKGHQLLHKGRRPSSFLDMSRLQLLNIDTQQCTLAKGEAKAVAAYLCANVEPFSTLSRERVKAIVQASSVVNLKRAQADSVSTEDILYKRGKVTATCPWSVLATDALTVSEGQFHPDFSAHIGSESVSSTQATVHSCDSGVTPPLSPDNN
eukprot:1156-Heterococcus_DN1.PRE.1